MTMRVLLGLLLATASAQVYDRALNEQDLQRLLPVLRADGAAADERAQQAAAGHALEATRAAAMKQAAGEIERGNDPLEWLRARSQHVVTPSTAIYSSTCSQALTASDSRPSAVLSFGISAPAGWLYVWKERDPGAIVPPATTTNRQTGTANTSTRAEALVQQTRVFYSGRGFEYTGERAPFEWQFVAPDKRVSATVMGVNVLGRLVPCRTLANGPAIVVRAENELFGKAPAAPAGQTARGAQQSFDEALQQAGLSETEYLNLKLQVLAARRDADEEDAGRAVGGRDPNEHEIRRQNARFYRDHRETLDPVVSRLARGGAPGQ